MKRIMLVIILISFAFGQDFGDTFWLSDRHKVITFGDILDYAEECYNDSTEDSYVRVLDSAEIIYFNHREPTFKGFIEWIGSKQ